MQVIQDVVIDRWMGPKADETTSFHIYVRTADNVEHDLVIYNMSKTIQHDLRKVQQTQYLRQIQNEFKFKKIPTFI